MSFMPSSIANVVTEYLDPYQVKQWGNVISYDASSYKLNSLTYNVLFEGIRVSGLKYTRQLGIGMIPYNIVNKNIQNLMLENTFPLDNFKSCVNIKSLTVHNPYCNKISYDINLITNFKKISYVCMCSIQSLPNNLYECSQLSTIHLMRSRESIDISIFVRCPSLKKLSLGNSKIINVSSFSACLSLRTLTLNEIIMDKLETSTMCPNLNKLCIYEGSIDLNFIKQNNHIKHLFLSDPTISNISFLSNFNNLKNLFLDQINSSDVTPLSKCPKLSQLTIAFMKFFSVPPLKCKRLKLINSEIKNINFTKMTNLQVLTVLSCVIPNFHPSANKKIRLMNMNYIIPKLPLHQCQCQYQPIIICEDYDFNGVHIQIQGYANKIYNLKRMLILTLTLVNCHEQIVDLSSIQLNKLCLVGCSSKILGLED